MTDDTIAIVVGLLTIEQLVNCFFEFYSTVNFNRHVDFLLTPEIDQF